MHSLSLFESHSFLIESLMAVETDAAKGSQKMIWSNWNKQYSGRYGFLPSMHLSQPIRQIVTLEDLEKVALSR